MTTATRFLTGIFVSLALLGVACASVDNSTTVDSVGFSQGFEEPTTRQVRSAPTITLARANWASGYIQVQILHDLLEELGYDVTNPANYELPPDAGYYYMAAGSIDVWANSWFPGHLTWWNNTLPDGSLVGDKLTRLDGSLMPGGGGQGYLISKQWADANNVTSFEQINSTPALYNALDFDGDGKGEIYGCPTQWTCDDIINSQLAFAGWNNLEQVSGGYDAMFADFSNKVYNGQPAVMYTWTPTSYVAAMEPGFYTMWLSMADANVLDASNPLNLAGGEGFCQRCGGEVGYKDLPPSQCTQGPNGCQAGWQFSDIEITTNTDFYLANPLAASFLDQYKPPMIDMAYATRDLFDSGVVQSEVELIAADWISNNRALADSWLEAAILAQSPLCNGQTPTVLIGAGQTPTSGNDIILGTPGDDTILALDGDDWVCGGDGDDTMYGGDGKDRLYGDAGNDALYGQEDRDVLQGGQGADYLDGGLRIDRLSGNAGHDILRGQAGKDQLRGHSGNDTLIGAGGSDLLLGGPGTDSANGGIGIDTCVAETIKKCE